MLRSPRLLFSERLVPNNVPCDLQVTDTHNRLHYWSTMLYQAHL